MSLTRKKIVLGTRKSKLALWQTDYIASRLKDLYPDLGIEIQHIVTIGDKTQASDKPLPEIGGKGLFTAELEDALAKKTIDIAVHSLKDLPTKLDDQFMLSAIPKREQVWDVMISKNGEKLSELKHGAIVGTSSVRRASQIKKIRPDITTESIRGNVDTRLSKLHDPKYNYDAIFLAYAGLFRIGLADKITQILSADEMLPAPGQGALAVQTRSDDLELKNILKPIHDEDTYHAVLAEREFLAKLEGGCNTPVAAYAVVHDNNLKFTGRCLSPDGQTCYEVSESGPADKALQIAQAMAEKILEMGAAKILRS